MAIQTRNLTNDELFDLKVKELREAADKSRLSKWALVDKLLECEDVLGDRFSQAVEVTRLSPGALNNYLSTGRAWPAALRHLDMPFDSHTALNPLTDEQKTAVMLMAKKSNWNRDDLRLRVAAHKAGDALAFDPRHKVEAPERPARKIIDVPDFHAGVKDENGSKEDNPVFDSTEAGIEMDAELRAENRREFKEARAERSFSTATEKLTYALGLLRELRQSGAMMSQIDASKVSAEACTIEGNWLAGIAPQIRHIQNTEFENPKPKAALAEATAGEAVRGDVPSASPNESYPGGETRTSRAATGGTSSAGTEGDADRHPNSHPATSSPPVTGGMVPSLPAVPPTHSNPVATASREAGSTGEGGAVYATVAPANHVAAHTCDEPDLPTFLDRRGHG